MAAINFEAITVLGGEFLEFNEIENYTSIMVDESNIGGGFHLEARGSGDQLWCSYDSNEFYLKLGRISMMDKGDEFLVNHNNFYGYAEEIFVLEKEAPGQSPEELVEIIVTWTHYYDFGYKNEKELGSIEKYISIRIPQGLIEEYQKWYSFRKMWNVFEEEIFFENFTIEVGGIEPIDDEEFVQFKTAWAEFLITKKDGMFYEEHCGYDKGCFWTDPEFIGDDSTESIESLKEKFVQIYGEYEE